MTPTPEKETDQPVRAPFRPRRLVTVPTLLSRLRKEGGGAAIPEFAMAITPVLILFFGMVQWCICAYVNLIVQHAAVVAARAEAVMKPAMPDNGGATGTGTDLEKAIAPLFVHIAGFKSIVGEGNLQVSVTDTGTRQCDQTINTVNVTLYYFCKVPLGNRIACGGFSVAGAASEAFGGGPMMQMTSKASFPNQGSYYQSVWSQQIGGGSCSSS
jgi:hypothetical protein